MFDIDSSITVWLFSILSAGLVGITGVIPVFVFPYETINYLSSRGGRNKLNYFLSFAVGSILGDVFLHLLPEVWDLYKLNPEFGATSKIGVITIIGIMLFLIIEKTCSNQSEMDVIETDQNHHEDLKESCENSIENIDEPANSLKRRKSVKKSNESREVDERKTSPIKIQGYLNLLANIVDNFVHGLAVGGSYTVSFRIGIITTLCILVHEIPHEVSDFAILLRSGFDRDGAIQAQLWTASSSLVGAIAALVFDSATAGLSQAYILPFSCGGFLYVALVTLVPDLTKERDRSESLKQIFLIILGISATWAAAVLETI